MPGSVSLIDGHVDETKETHKMVRVDNLMYDGCEPHWKCIKCGKCIPFHCYTKEECEQQECKSRK